MPRPKKKQTRSNEKKDPTRTDDGGDDHYGRNELPIARAVSNSDLEALGKIIESSLPNRNNATVEDVSVEQSVGEAFTGGRSTPVYYVRARVRVGGENSAAEVVRDRRFVVKLVTVPFDTGNSTTKANIKRESYCVERRFYEYVAPTLKRHSIATPKLLASDNPPNQSSTTASTFCWLMTDVRVQFPRHPPTLDPRGTLWSALDWLARFHARHWDDPSGEWRRSVWDRGGFWNQPIDDCGGISARWRPTCQWMNSRHGDLVPEGCNVGTIGTRLQALHGPLARFMARQSRSAGWSTLLHGDFKAANLFFSSNGSGSGDGGNVGGGFSDTESCCAVDFQYVGAGVPAEDLAYLLFPDAKVDYCDSESLCLGYYHERLTESLMAANRGGPSSLPLESLVALYELSRLQLLSYWLVHGGWVGSTDGDARLVLAVDETLRRIEGCRSGGMGSERNDCESALEKFVHK